MKFKFDANQQYQLDAVNAVVELFKGQRENRGAHEISFRKEASYGTIHDADDAWFG